MSGLFGGPAPAAPAPPPPPPTRSDAEVRQAALDQRLRRAAAVGRSETIKTSPSGVTEDAQIVTKTLLGS